MNPRQLQRLALGGLAALALVVLLVLVLAYYAHNGYDVALKDTFLAVSLTTWNTFGAIAFVVLVVAAIVVAWNPARGFGVLELAPDKTGPNLHVRCKSCGVVHWVEMKGEAPLKHFCPNCAQEGTYGEAGGDEEDFLYTQVEIKLGCRHCNSSFSYPEPLVRPLFVKCPNCGSHGVLGPEAKAVDAFEEELACPNCQYAFHAYEVPERGGPAHIACPRCETMIPRGEKTAARGKARKAGRSSRRAETA